MGARLFLIRKYIFTSGSKVVSVFALLSVLSIALGVSILIIVTGIMNGFQSELKRRILILQPHLHITHPMGVPFRDVDKVLKELRGMGIDPSPAILTKVIVRQGNALDGVVLRSQDLQHIHRELKDYMVMGKIDTGAIIGASLASRLGVDPGFTIEIVSLRQTPFGPQMVPYKVKVVGVFETGLMMHDDQTIIVDINTGRKIMGLKEDETPLIFGYVPNPYEAGKYCREVVKHNYGCTSWQSINRTLFTALKMERLAISLSFALILIISAINVVVSITMLTLEKRWEIGLMKALGFTKWDVTSVFTGVGGILGILGALLGSVFGWAISYVTDTYRLVKIPADVYMIDYVPIKPQVSDWIVIMVLTLVISLLAAYIPAVIAARLKPVDALRKVV